MRLLVVAAVVALVPGSALAADKDEEKAKDAAVAFLKAVKTKDADAVMKTAGVPFAHREGDNIVVIKDEAALKAWLKDRLAEIKDPSEIPTTVDKVHTFAELKDKIKDEEQRKTIEEVVGQDGYIAIIVADGKMVPILVRMKSGKAAVVGIVGR